MYRILGGSNVLGLTMVYLKRWVCKAVLWLVPLGTMPLSTVWAASVWNFETITQITVPAGCSSPEVRLTGLDYDLPADNRPIAGWSEKLGCAGGSGISQIPKWARKSVGTWVLSSLGNPNCTPSPCAELPGIPELVVSSGGVPFYVYAAPGAGADSGNTYIWRADLSASPTGPGFYTGPTDLIGGVGACTTFPFIAADFTPSGGLPQWARGANCPGPIRLNGTVDLNPSATIAGLDYATGPSGQDHVIYYAATAVFYSNGTAGNAISILTTTQQRGIALAVDGANTVHGVIGGADTVPATTEGQLLYMKLSGGTWSQEVIDSTGGRNPSIALDSSGNPCVSYWRAPNEVRFGCKTGSGWNIQRVTTTQVGTNSDFLQATETRLVFDHALSPKPAILAYRPSSLATNPSGMELLLLANSDLAPIVTQPNNQANHEGDVVRLQINATDEPGDSLVYSAVGLPPGLSIGSTGLITGIVSFSAAQLGPVYSVIVYATDGTLVGNKNFQWTITDTNRLPSVFCPFPSPTLSEGTSISPAIQIVGSDPDQDALSYGFTSVPPASWLNISSGGLITGIPGFSDAGNYTVTLSVTDNKSAPVTIDCLWTVNNVNAPPTVSSIPNQRHNEGTVIPGFAMPAPGLSVIATDADGDVLQYAASNLPPNLSISAGNGVITGTISFSAAGTHQVTVDVCEVARPTVCSNRQFTWIVDPVNQPPVMTAVPGQNSNEGSSIASLQIITTDPDPNTTLTFGVSGLPPGLVMSATGLITGTPPFNASAGSPYTVTVSVSDGALSDSEMFQWIVVDQSSPPVVINPGPQSSTENTSVSLRIVANDLDNPSATPTLGLSYSVTGLPSPLTIDSTGLISGPTPLVVGSYTTTVTVTDASNQATAVVFSWSVSNVNQPPVFSNAACPSPINEGVPVSSFVFEATDPDLDTLKYSANNLPPGLSINTSTGGIQGTPTFTAALGSPYAVVVTVSDGVTPVVSKNCPWVVNNTNGPPSVIYPGDQATAIGVASSLPLSGTDPDLPGDDLTFTVFNAPTASPPMAITKTGPSSASLSGTPNVAGTFNVVVRATDTAGLFNDITFRWDVGSTNQPPAFTSSPPNMITPEQGTGKLEIFATDLDQNPITYAFTGTNLPASLTAVLNSSVSTSTGVVEWTPAYIDAGIYNLTAIVKDSIGLSVQRDFTWTVTQTNRDPSFVSTLSPQTSAENSTVSLAVAAQDPDITSPNTQNPSLIDTLSYSAINLPPGLSINLLTGEITGTILFSASRTPYHVSVTVTDSAGSQRVTAFDWTVTNTNRSPTLAAMSNRADAEGTTPAVFDLSLLAGDPDVPEDTLTYSATGLPPGLAIDTATGKIAPILNAPLSYTSAGVYPVEACISDGSPPTLCQRFTWTINNVNRPPSLANVPSQSSCEDDVVSLFLQGSDLDSGETLTYVKIQMPAAMGLSLNTATGEIYGRIPFTAAGTAGASYSVKMQVKDGASATSLVQTFAWNICNKNRPPAITPPLSSETVVNENSTFFLDIVANDPDSDPLQHTATGLPLWLSIEPSTGIITGLPPYTAAGTYPIEVCVADRVPLGADGFKVCHSFSITVNNTNRPPIVTNPAGPSGQLFNKEDDSLSIPVIATDPDTPDQGDVLTYSAVVNLPSGLNINLPPGLNINPVTGVIYGTLALTASNNGPYTVSVSATDGNLVTTQLFVWNVLQNRPCTRATLCHRTITPANGRKVPIRVRRVSRGATVVITKIVQDEPTNPVGGDGTAIDAGGVGLSRAWVRAERDPNGDGRVYEIFFDLTERIGQKYKIYKCSLKVYVPSASGQRVDSRPTTGLEYDSRVSSQ